MKTWILLKMLVSLPLVALWGQPADTTIAVLWDSIYYAERAEAIHDILVLPSRNIMVVGSARDGDNTDGLFMLVDTGGHVLLRKYLGKTLREDVFWGGTEAEDGTFYLVGHSYAGPDLGNQAWIVHLNENGDELPMKENYFGGPGDDRFNKIIWTDNNLGIIAGTKSNSRPGYLPVFQVNRTEVMEMPSIGEGMVEDLTIMEKSPAGGGIWLAGNARKSDITRKGDIWVCKVDDRGAALFTDKVSNKYLSRLAGGSANFEGNLLLAGEIFGSTTGDSDGWISEYVPGSKKQAPSEYFGEDYDDFASLLYLTPRQEKWVVMTNSNTRSVSVQVYKGKDLKERGIYQISKQSQFDLNKLLQMKINTYLLAGTGYDASLGREAVRITGILDKEIYSWRGQPVLEVSDFSFSDDDGNANLAAEEYGAIRFRLKNKGSAPVEEGVIKAELVGTFGGFTIKRPFQVIPFLPQNGEKNCAVAIFGEKTLGSGTATVKITIEVKGLDPLEYTYKVPCRQEKVAPPPVAGVTINYVTPRPGTGGGGNVRQFEATEKMYTVETAINTTRGNARVTDAKTYLQHTPLTDQKASPVLTDPIPSGDKRVFTYYYKVQVPLEEGRNVIYIEFEGQKSDSIIVNFAPKLPNLHILAIGIPASDLNHTVNDARDFAAAMQAQGERGLFNRIQVNLLATSDSTTNNALGVAFQSLRDAAYNSQIKPNDYLLVFISSHGVKGKDGRFYLRTSGCNPQFESTMFDYEYYLERYLNPINCKHKLLFIDACHSGAASTSYSDNTNSSGAGAAKGPSQTELARALMEANTAAAGMATFTSCSADEVSYEHSSWQNGAFTEALLEAFSRTSNADTGSWVKEEGKYVEEPDDIITIDELKTFLESRVPALVREKINEKAGQHPVIMVDAPKMTLPLIILP